MDISRGMFDELCASSRSSRSGTRSSCRSETFSSMEVLSPEQETHYMAEELSDEEEEPNSAQKDIAHNDSARKVETNTNCKGKEPAASPDSPEEAIDPELQRAIENMKKYDRILRKKMKYEKEVKLQTILFQKQMIEEMTSKPTRNEVLFNTNKYLALMPAIADVNDMIIKIENDEEIAPIFPTQLSAEYSFECRSGLTTSEASKDESCSEGSKERTRKATSHEQTQDFIKRNIEIAKDAASYVPMTDDQKKRLNELLSDLDNLELDDSNEKGDPSAGICAIVGEGYTPDEDERKRLADIDQRIEALTSGQDIKIMQETNSHSFVEDSEQFGANFPGLTDEQLQQLLADCSTESSRLSSRMSGSARTMSDSSFSRNSTSLGSLSHVDRTEEFNEKHDSNYSADSVVQPLSREILDKLLEEARLCLGIKNNTKRTFEDEGETDNENHNETSSTQFKDKLFQKVPQQTARNSSANLSTDINVEEVLEEM